MMSAKTTAAPNPSSHPSFMISTSLAPGRFGSDQVERILKAAKASKRATERMLTVAREIMLNNRDE